MICAMPCGASRGTWSSVLPTTRFGCRSIGGSLWPAREPWPPPSIAPGEGGVGRLVLETPWVARGGDRFVRGSFPPVPPMGGGVVLAPFAPPRPRLRRRRLAVEQGPAARLGVLAVEAGLMGL